MQNINRESSLDQGLFCMVYATYQDRTSLCFVKQSIISCKNSRRGVPMHKNV